MCLPGSGSKLLPLIPAKKKRMCSSVKPLLSVHMVLGSTPSTKQKQNKGYGCMPAILAFKAEAGR